MIKFIGSKRLLVPHILKLSKEFGEVSSVCDLFTGTTRVACAFKGEGMFVHANDTASFAFNLAQTYIATDSLRVDRNQVNAAIDRLNKIEGVDGYFARAFALEAAYFQPQNAKKIDAIRNAIEVEPEEIRPILLTALMLAADKVDSTTGLQMAYLKSWSPRSFNPLRLECPELLAGPGNASQEDALDLAPLVDADLAYIDPPYNQHSYLSNYHVWETLIRHDSPESYGVANKRIDCRVRKSPFNQRSEAASALKHVISSLKSRYLILSFNDEGYVGRSTLESILGKWGTFKCVEVPYKRYVGAKIGIHNKRGERVGTVGRLHNHEFLFAARRHG